MDESTPVGSQAKKRASSSRSKVGSGPSTPFTARRRPSDAGVTAADDACGYALLIECGDEAFSVLRRQGCQQRAGCNEAERVQRERVADDAAFGQHRNALRVNPSARRLLRWRVRAARSPRRPRWGRALHAHQPCRRLWSRAFATLMPGVNSSDFACSMTDEGTPFAARTSSASRASMEVPSMATPCVSTMLSPTCAPDDSTTLSFATSPSSAPMAMGRGRSYVISVWPPMSVMPSESQASRSCVEYRFRLLFGRAFGQQQRRHQPARRGAHRGEVVGVDLHQVPADQVSGECDRVGLGDEVAVAHVDQGGVLSGARAQAPHAGRVHLCQRAAAKAAPSAACQRA